METRFDSIKPQYNIQLDSTLLAVQAVSINNKVPWELMWGPDNTLWYNEQDGRIFKIDHKTGKSKLLLAIKDVYQKNTSGLLGMVAVASDTQNPESFLFVAYSFKNKDNVGLKLVRYLIEKDTLMRPKTFCTITGYRGHFGSRIVLSADKKLFWATGDGAVSGAALDAADLKGKVLRFNLDGTVPSDNPIAGSPVWARGFRNIQGMVFSGNNLLYTSEHGDASDDEVNIVQKGGNYGWDKIEGAADTDAEKAFAGGTRIIEPVMAWTPTIAPAGLTFYNNSRIPEWKNSLLLVSLKDRSLRVLKRSANGARIADETIYLDKVYGRLRAVCVSPDGDVYLSTSNKDWNPYRHPAPDDDKILRITPVKKISAEVLHGKKPERILGSANVASLYEVYCSGCHKQDGSGSPGVFPALIASPVVHNKSNLIDVFLWGKSTKGVQEKMPSFKFLNDDEAAAILNYVRSSWGNNNKDSITKEAVQAYRAAKSH
ncbi:PQQ-dependent sugar dehydrogenase [Niabella beijingensis]|uniref:PQQ-dependent sugar dehydrogenase n=1 Tax=Niabella beijingensis TaxID=2872700 RepID=UPI001CBAF789|nr:PQQ-dependent sugar dehydrogenase [Niabella beijingensis]